MDQRVPQLRSSTLDHNVLMHLHIAHGDILIPGAALEAALAAAKERELAESGSAVAKCASQEMHAQSDVVTIVEGIGDGLRDLIRKFGRQSLVGVQEEDPFIGKWERIHGPLTFLGPTAAIVELNHFRVKG